MVRAGDELVRSLHRGAGNPRSICCSQPWQGGEQGSCLHHFVGTSASGARPIPQPGAHGVTQGLPLPLSSHPWARLVWAGRKASLCPAELPCLTCCLNQASMRHLRFVHQYLISASPTHQPPLGGSEGLRLYAAHADRQQPGSARQSRPLSACHLKIKGERGGGGSDGKPGLPASLPLHRCPGDRMRRPRGGFGHVSKFLGFSDAGQMETPKQTSGMAFSRKTNCTEMWGCVPGKGGMSVMPASSLGGLPAEILHFWKWQIILFQGFS